MDDNNKKFEVDEFWNDCINNPYSTNIYNNQFKDGQRNSPFKNKRKLSKKPLNNNNYTNINDMDYLKSKIISNTQISKYLQKNIKEALKKEELIPLKKHKIQEKINKKFIDLYNKDIANKSSKQKSNYKQLQLKENLQISKCTFKPDVCKNKKLKKKINRLYSDSNIYQRNIKLQQKHNEKVAFLFNENNKINKNNTNSECPFHPYIIYKDIGKMLYDDSVWKNKVDNDSNKLFMLRYMKAREEEYYKREKLTSPVNKKINLKINFSYPNRMKRTISQKDSLIMKKQLHNTLYSFNNLFTEDDDDNNDINVNDNNNKEGKENSVNEEKKIDNFQWTFAKKN